MTSLKQSMHNPAYLFGSVTILLFYAAWGIWWSFFQIWLTSAEGGLQLSGAQVGTVYAFNGAGTMVLMLLYGAIQDKLDLKRHLTITAACIMTFIGPFTTWIYRPLLAGHFYVGVLAGAIVLSAGFIGASSLFEAFVERLSRRFAFEFGHARMWGSFGYAIVALIAGYAFTINPLMNFWIGSALGLASLLVQLFWYPGKTLIARREGQARPSTPSFGEMTALLTRPQVWTIIVFVLLSWTFYTVFDQQMFPDFYTTLFDTATKGQHMYATLNSVQVFLEALMMGVVPLLMRRTGARNTLLLGVLVMFLRILGCAVFSGPIMISFVKLFHSLEVPLFVLAMFKYISIHFNPALSATLYLVAFNLSSQLGNVILSNPLGRVRDSIGYQHTFSIISGIVAISAIWAFFALKRDTEDVYSDEGGFAPSDANTANAS